MKRMDFEILLNKMQVREEDNLLERGNLALLTTYVNKQGDRSEGIFLRNIQYPCSFPGCFEADCYSHARHKEIAEIYEGYGIEQTASSRRVFSIARVETAEIICL